MTISGIHGAKQAEGTGGNIYDQAFDFAKASVQQDIVRTFSNFFNPKRIPEHVLLLYPKFASFIEKYFEWLASENEIGVQELITDIDTTPDEMIKVFKEIYAYNFPDESYRYEDGVRTEKILDFNFPNSSIVDVRNFLANCKDLYQRKGTPQSFEYFLRVFFDSDSTITEPKTFVLRCSDAPYRGVCAGTTGAICYHWGLTAECVSGADTLGINPDDYGGCPTGPCWTDSFGRLCWAGGSYDANGNEILPPCDKPGCAPGSPCGVYYDDELGTLSGLSRLQDSKYWQNYSFLIDTQVPVDAYLPTMKRLFGPAGLYIGANYSVWDEIPQAGITGDIYPVEQPIIGNYAPYRLQTFTNLRNNDSGVDLYPCGYNPEVGATYTSQHTIDSGGLLFKNEDGSTAHQPYFDRTIGADVFAPLGKTGHTGGLQASQIGMDFFRVYHHPSSWSYQVPEGISFGAISLGEFIFLSAIDISIGSPNNPAGTSGGSGIGCP